MNTHVHPLFASALNAVANAQREPANPLGKPLPQGSKLTLAEPGTPTGDYLTQFYDRADKAGRNTGD